MLLIGARKRKIIANWQGLTTEPNDHDAVTAPRIATATAAKPVGSGLARIAAAARPAMSIRSGVRDLSCAIARASTGIPDIPPGDSTDNPSSATSTIIYARQSCATRATAARRFVRTI